MKKIAKSFKTYSYNNGKYVFCPNALTERALCHLQIYFDVNSCKKMWWMNLDYFRHFFVTKYLQEVLELRRLLVSTAFLTAYFPEKTEKN